MALEDSSAGRLIGVLAAPGKTFRAIAERPTWVVALVVLALLGAGLGMLVQNRTDQRQMIEKQMAKFGGNMTEKQIDEAVERAQHPTPLVRTLSLVGGLIGQAIGYLLPAFLFWVAFKLAGSEMPFKSSFSTYLHASVPLAIAFLLSLPVILSRQSVQPADMLTGGLLASSPAFFLPAGTSPTVKAALTTFDVFNLWSLALCILGYRIVARVSTAVAASAAVVLWLLGMGLRIAGAAFLAQERSEWRAAVQLGGAQAAPGSLRGPHSPALLLRQAQRHVREDLLLARIELQAGRDPRVKRVARSLATAERSLATDLRAAGKPLSAH